MPNYEMGQAKRLGGETSKMIHMAARTAMRLVCLLTLCSLVLADTRIASAAGVTTRINVPGHYSVTVPNDWLPMIVPNIDVVFRAPDGNILVGVTARRGVAGMVTMRKALKAALAQIGRPAKGLVENTFLMHGVPAVHLSALLITPSGRQGSVAAIITSHRGRFYVAMGFVRDLSRQGAGIDLHLMTLTVNSLRLL